MKQLIPPELRSALAALLASAIGTLAGILVNSGFGLGGSSSDFVYGLLGPVFDRLAASPGGQLVFAAVIYRVPVVLMVGLLVGLMLRRVRFRPLLLGSVLIWPVHLVGRKIIGLIPAIHSEVDAAVMLLRSTVVPEALAYLMQYSLLFMVIGATNALLARQARPAA